MNFDYKRRTQDFYQGDDVARRYHEMLASSGGWRNLRTRVVTRAEKCTIETLLARIPHRSALDIPAGTGKLANVFAALGTRVVASDISRSMLEFAKAEYSRIGYEQVTFRIQDAVDLGEFRDGEFDAVVCLRLMHRVPAAFRGPMLGGFARIAPYAIVSFGIENGYQKLRRTARVAIFGGRKDALCSCTMPEVLAELDPLFEIVEGVWIAPVFSQEMIFLLKSRQMRDFRQPCHGA